MRTVPNEQAAKIAWFRARLAAWNANLALLGLTAPELATLTSQVEAAEDGLAERTEADNVAKAKTAILNAAVESLATNGGRLVNKIRANAELAADPTAVYAAAQVPAPATPTTIGAPGLPTGMTATLNPDGSLKLGWECSNPAGSQGVLYHVYRQLNATGDFTFIGGSGKREFTDASVPSALAMIVYKIQAVRTTAIGLAAEFIVRFGTTESGAMTATVSESSPKLAA